MKFEEFLMESEITDLLKELKGTPYYLKAPNGKPSNLPEKQWLMVRTKSFKNWFGDWEDNPQNASKVIDDNGEPMITHHGSDALAKHNTFTKSATYFTNSKNTANDFSVDKSLEKLKSKKHLQDKYFPDGGRILTKVYDVFLSIQNPLIVDAESSRWDEIKTPKEMGNKGVKTTDQIVRWAKKSSFDGVIFKNILDGSSYKNEINFVTFESSQIKSINNKGDFSKSSNNIND